MYMYTVHVNRSTAFDNNKRIFALLFFSCKTYVKLDAFGTVLFFLLFLFFPSLLVSFCLPFYCKFCLTSFMLSWRLATYKTFPNVIFFIFLFNFNTFFCASISTEHGQRGSNGPGFSQV